MAGKKNRNAYLIKGATPGIVLGLVAFILSLMDKEGVILASILGFIVFAVLAPIGVLVLFFWDFLANLVGRFLMFAGHLFHIHSLEQLQLDDDIPEKKEEFFDSIERMLSPMYT